MNLFFQKTGQFKGSQLCFVRVRITDLQAQHAAERWIPHHTPVSQVILIKPLIIARDSRPDRITVRLISLQDRQPLISRPACPACDLGEHLKTVFIYPVIVKIRPNIREQNSDQTHIRKIQPLCHHLRTDQDVCFMCGETGK